jgi:MFS family permease
MTSPEGADGDPPPPPTADPYAALRIADFRRLLAASMLGTIAAEMQTVAVAWELTRRTGSPLALGMVGLVQVVPVLLLALPAGQAADRWPRKRIVMAAQAVLGMVSTALALATAARAPLPTIYAGLAVAGCGLAFAMPARAALLPQLVPALIFPNAVAWRTTGWQVASVAGPALGGTLLAITRGTVPVLWGAAIVHAAVVLIQSGLTPHRAPRERVPMNLGSMLGGIRHVARNDLILAAIALDMFAVLLGGATALLPIFARDILHIGEVGFGWLRAAPSLGAAVMALVIAHRPPFRRAGRVLLLSVAGFGVATIVFGLSRNVVLSFAALAAAGALDNISVVVRSTLVQLLTPDAMRGRVAAVNSVFVGMSNELGAFESGVTATWWGPTVSVLVGGTGCIVVVAAAALRWPRLLALGTLVSATRAAEHPQRIDVGRVMAPSDADDTSAAYLAKAPDV